MSSEGLTKAVVLQVGAEVQKDLLTSRTITLKSALREMSPSRVLYVLFRKLFRRYIAEGYEYVDGYNFREAVLRARLTELEQGIR